MLALENTFARDRLALVDQYVNAWRNEEAFTRHDARMEQLWNFVSELEGEPHSVIKARCLARIIETAPVYVNPNDWFGISLEAAKMEPLTDIGVFYWRPLLELNKKWMAELDEQLNLPQDEHFAK